MIPQAIPTAGMVADERTLEIARLLADFAEGKSLDGELYGEDEWNAACDYAIDSGDWHELDFMLDREAAYHRFRELPEATADRYYLGDFETFCEREAPFAVAAFVGAHNPALAGLGRL